jgi:hypothetical protein
MIITFTTSPYGMIATLVANKKLVSKNKAWDAHHLQRTTSQN